MLMQNWFTNLTRAAAVVLSLSVMAPGIGIAAPNASKVKVKGFNLSESDGFVYDAVTTGAPTPAMIAVDEAARLGSNHVILNVRGKMVGPTSTEVVPMTAPAERSNEARRIARLANYIRSKGMTVGMRPIFFVFGPNGEFPYTEKLANGTSKVWWHGNIQPSDPDRWFESFRTFLDQYITVARLAKAEEFTIAAELYSMTVGIEDQWKAQPYGFPGRWLELLRYVRGKLPTARLMYDINFTDDSNSESGFARSGGELERWRYRLADLANPTRPEELKIWKDLVQFWTELDAVGLDMYRSLASSKDVLATNRADLTRQLKTRTDVYTTQLDTALLEISLVTNVEKQIILKEVGYRSIEKGFIEPFNYASASGVVNIDHQAAAYDALLASFARSNWSWFQGVVFWDIQVDPSKKGPKDLGFSPVGKPQTEAIVIDYFKTM
ncbi:MAG: hypothetical protein U1E10_16260 [Bdellovibrionales bacterium]|nr:hypothetical protein [Bdellovibrionales bacterium]